MKNLPPMNNATPPNVLSRAVANLFPGYFALVMATGIISIACFLLQMTTISFVLLVINIVAYAVLCLLLLLRLVFFFSRVKADINDHVRGPGFFTVVAGTCVLGSQLLIVLDLSRIAAAFWVLGLILWLVIMYTFF